MWKTLNDFIDHIGGKKNMSSNVREEQPMLLVLLYIKIMWTYSNKISAVMALNEVDQ
jgi:hypothetical protein